MYYITLFSRLSGDSELCLWWAIHFFLFPKYHEGQGLSFKKHNLYLCIIIFNIKFVVTLKFRCCLRNICCSRSRIWVRLCVIIGSLCEVNYCSVLVSKLNKCEVCISFIWYTFTLQYWSAFRTLVILIKTITSTNWHFHSPTFYLSYNMSYMGSDSKTIRHNEKFSSLFSGENSKLD